jgi:N-acetylglucosamine malate deacetylase 1
MGWSTSSGKWWSISAENAVKSSNFNKMRKIFILTIAFCLIAMVARCTIVVIAPHPDDAESSCGGLIANSISSGERVIILTMTKGERGIYGRSMSEAAEIRQMEAQKGAFALGAEIEFFGAIDGSLSDDSANTMKLKSILKRINPSIVLAPWPLDVHNDHQATGMLTWRVFMDREMNFDLYFYETINEPNTTSFRFIPTDYVDITPVIKQKREATLEHKSQHAEDWYPMYEKMSEIRGYEADVKYAEAYVKAQNSDGMGGRAARVKKTLEK